MINQALSTNLEEILEFEVPENLYVPTPPLWIESKGFKGPLDLLWYLIKKQNIDILDIPVALIAAQYVQYIKMMSAYRFEIAPDYLVMAVRLIQIKSQMLLPKKPDPEVHEEDPRALLVKQLEDYEDIQKTAQHIDKLLRWERDVWPLRVTLGAELPEPLLPELELSSLLESYTNVHKKLGFQRQHEITRLRLSLSDRMHEIFSSLDYNVRRDFSSILLDRNESLDVAVSFQAVLELAKNSQIVLEQSSWDDLLWLKRAVK